MTSSDAVFRLPPPDALVAWAFPWEVDIEGPRWRETNDAFHMERGVRGFRRKDIAIEVRGRILEVWGKRERGLVKRERRAFRDVLELPQGADASDVTAEIRGQHLRIRIGKEPSVRWRQIPVRSQSELTDTSTTGPASTALDRGSWLPTPFLTRVVNWIRMLGLRTRSWVNGV